jgi:hypothetical protein
LSKTPHRLIRAKTRETCTGAHLPPRAAGMRRSLRPAAIRPSELLPSSRMERITGSRSISRFLALSVFAALPIFRPNAALAIGRLAGLPSCLVPRALAAGRANSTRLTVDAYKRVPNTFVSFIQVGRYPSCSGRRRVPSMSVMSRYLEGRRRDACNLHHGRH